MSIPWNDKLKRSTRVIAYESATINQYIEFKEETIEKYEARLEEKLGEEILIEVMINKN